jgi:hypothetical protein
MTGACDLSFVIPVRSDAARLRQCLESIRANDYPAERVEIIVVVDRNSSDDSAAVGTLAGATVLHASRGPVAHLRNLGADAARGPLLAFVDADHLLAMEWITVAVNSFTNASIGAVGSLYRAPADGTWVQRAYDRLRGRAIGRHAVQWLGAGNLVVRRSAFDQVGGFDTRLKTCEDVDLSKRLRSNGFTLISDDRLLSIHVGDPSTLGALFCGELWRGRSNLTVSVRPPITARELASICIPVVQLAGLLGATLSIGFAGPARLVLLVLFLCPLVVVPAWRAARMSTQCKRRTLRKFSDNALVALVYDLARALALITPVTHQLRRR